MISRLSSKVDINWTLYGTTPYGGDGKGCSGRGCGAVFSVSTSGTESVLYRLKGAPYERVVYL